MPAPAHKGQQPQEQQQDGKGNRADQKQAGEALLYGAGFTSA
jgi:hypothetical protein